MVVDGGFLFPFSNRGQSRPVRTFTIGETKLGLASGYHQVLVRRKDRAKTAFSADDRHYEFKGMAFGSKGASATLQG